MLTSRGLGTVLGDLAALGYDARWCVLGACDAGAPHKRERIWIRGERVWQRVKFAHDCSECECCGEPWCDECGCHYDECRCPGPTQDDVYEYSECGEWAKKLADSGGEGLEGFAGDGANGDQPGRDGEEPRRSTGAGRVRWWDSDPADVADTESAGTWNIRENNGSPCREIDALEHSGGTERGDCESGHRPEVGDSTGEQRERHRPEPCGEQGGFADAGRWATVAGLGRVAHGVAHRVDRLRAIGNGQVPAVVRLAWDVLSGK